MVTDLAEIKDIFSFIGLSLLQFKLSQYTCIIVNDLAKIKDICSFIVPLHHTNKHDEAFIEDQHRPFN